MKHLEAVLLPEPNSPPIFTWVTAGDSPAAGHGNLCSQSYTAILEETVQHHFEASGIQFRAKNYASAPELALCMNEVFGGDIDVVAT